MKFLITLSFLLMTFFSCKSILTKSVGINNIRSFSDKDLKKLALDYSVDTPIYTLNSEYINYAKSLKDSSTIKYLMQPLQIIFFNNGQVASHLVNCIVGGFPNLKWNRYGTFDTLPNVNHPILVHNLSIDTLFHYINPTPLLIKSEKICIVFWSNFMGRQSKNLIEYSKRNSVKNNYHVIYVNNDNFYYYLENTKN